MYISPRKMDKRRILVEQLHPKSAIPEKIMMSCLPSSPKGTMDRQDQVPHNIMESNHSWNSPNTFYSHLSWRIDPILHQREKGIGKIHNSWLTGIYFLPLVALWKSNPFFSLVREHFSITSSKRWVCGVRKWQFLMIYSAVDHQRGGWVGLKKPKTW